MLDQPNHEIRQSEMAINDARIHCISMQFALFGFFVDRWTLQRTVLCCARLGFALAPVNFATPTAGRPLRQSRFRRFGGFTGHPCRLHMSRCCTYRWIRVMSSLFGGTCLRVSRYGFCFFRYIKDVVSPSCVLSTNGRNPYERHRRSGSVFHRPRCHERETPPSSCAHGG